jgi:hypothetical protein
MAGYMRGSPCSLMLCLNTPGSAAIVAVEAGT